MAKAIVTPEEAIAEIEELVEEKAAADAAEEEEMKKGMADVRRDEMSATWWEAFDEDGNPIHVGQIVGLCEFVIHEGKDDKEQPAYSSSMFKNPQDDLETALGYSFKNVAQRAFKKRWNELFPPEKRKQMTREKQAEKIARLQSETQIERQEKEIALLQGQVMATAMAAGKMPTVEDFAEVGVPVPEYLQAALGLSAA